MNNIFSKLKASLTNSNGVSDESLAIPVDGYADNEESDERGKKRFYGFKIGEIQLLIDADVRSEVLSDVAITSVPLMPSYVRGLCNVRGSLVPVYDMHKKLGLDAPNISPSNKKILLLDENQDMAGIEIEEMVVSLQFDEQDIERGTTSDNEMLNGCITYCYKENDKTWFGFDHTKLFDSTYTQAL